MGLTRRPRLDDVVEFSTRGLIRVGRIIAVDETGFYFRIETLHTKHSIHRNWHKGKAELRIPLSRIKRILPEESELDNS